MSFALSRNQSRPYDAFTAMGVNLAFALGKNYGDHIGKLIQDVTEKNTPKIPDIFEVLPPFRKDTQSLLMTHAEARGESYEFYKKKISLIVSPPPSQEDTIDSIRAKNLVAWKYFFTECRIGTVKEVLDFFDASNSGWVNPGEVAAILAH